jgi:hypothetical protein
VGLDSANLDFFGHPPKHPLADTYYSQAPIRYGDYVAKVSVAPTAETRAAAEAQGLDPHAGFSPLLAATVGFFKQHGAEFEFRVSSAPTSAGCRSRTPRSSGRRRRARTGPWPG